MVGAAEPPRTIQVQGVGGMREMGWGGTEPWQGGSEGAQAVSQAQNLGLAAP